MVQPDVPRILVADCGNTRAHLGLVSLASALDAPPVARFDLHVPFSRRELEDAVVARLLKPGHLHHPENLDAVVVASVNLKARAPIEAWTTGALGEDKFVLLGRDAPIPIENAVVRPEVVGKDRLVAALAASQYYPRRSVVVLDFGTAITVDAVSPRGAYLGGIIAPGVRLALRALYENTALLPLVEFGEKPQPLGSTTEEAISAGVFYGYPAMVGGLIETLRVELQHRYQDEPAVVATGGDALRLVEDMPAGTVDRVLPYLTLTGIRLAYEASH